MKHESYWFNNSSQARMKIHSEGCFSIISRNMHENATSLVATIVGTLFLQVININLADDGSLGDFLQFVGLLFSFFLANSIKKECEIV